MRKWLFTLIPKIHVFLYRLTNGRLGGEIMGLPLLLLTTTGRKSGKERTVPLAYLKDGANYVITASNAGLPTHPAWFWNLTSNPQATIQVKDVRQAVVAEEAGPEERSRLWAQLIEVAPGYANYQKSTPREIPMVILRPAD
jgi:deazaflavin-dependent oxidoreductase (nitroreductase family)